LLGLFEFFHGPAAGNCRPSQVPGSQINQRLEPSRNEFLAQNLESFLQTRAKTLSEAASRYFKALGG
jgi:hypothetical protein